MSDPGPTRDVVEEYVNLAMIRRRQAVPAVVKTRMQDLEDRLRDDIDGARPAPKKIKNPRAAPETRPAAPVPPARVEITSSPRQPKLDLHAFVQQVPLSERDAAKTKSISVAQAESGYTPSRSPAYLSDYYDDSIVPYAVDAEVRPRAAVTPDGAPSDMSVEARTLFGVGIKIRDSERATNPVPSKQEAEPVAAPEAAADAEVATMPASPVLDRVPPVRMTPISQPQVLNPPSSQPPSAGVQAVVYLLDGTSARGVLPRFDPREPEVEVHHKGGAARYELEQVMNIFFRIQAGKAPTPARGAPVLVRLVNDREIVGVTPDYEPGGMALTVVPVPRHGSVDRVWIPAWAVKAIEMDDVDD